MRPSSNGRCPCGSGKKYKHCCQARGVPAGPPTRDFLEDALVRLERLMGQGGPLSQIRFEPEGFARVLSEQLQQQGPQAVDGESLLAGLLESSISSLWTDRFVELARTRLQAALEEGLAEADHAAVALALSTLERVVARQGRDPLLCPISPIAFRLQLREWLEAERRLAAQLEEAAAGLGAQLSGSAVAEDGPQAASGPGEPEPRG